MPDQAIPAPSATTRVAGVIGSPIAHSLSPAILNAAFSHAALDWVYVAFEVPAGGVADALAGMRALGIAGLSVTMPHKHAVAEAVDEMSADARLLGAVNCVVNEGGRLVGHNTDGGGFLRSVRESEPTLDLDGAKCVVLGAGGAARAIVVALCRRGADVVVVNRTEAAAVSAAALDPSARVGSAGDARDAALVVNATSVGMGGAGNPGAVPIDPALLGPSQVVADIVYLPRETPLLVAARERGARTIDGVGMLVGQAALAFELWTGEPAPIDAMRAAADAALRSRA